MRYQIVLGLALVMFVSASAEAQILKGLTDKIGAAKPAISGTSSAPISGLDIEGLTKKAKECNDMSTTGMVKCATALGPDAAKLASKTAESGVLGEQVKQLSAAITSMSQGNHVKF